MEDEFKFANIRTVFAKIIQSIPPTIMEWSEEDISLNKDDLNDNLNEIRRAIDAYTQIRKPHLEL